MIRHLRKRGSDAIDLLRSPYLSWRAKIQLASVLARRAPRERHADLQIAVGGAELSLQPSYYPDFATFRDIFLKQVYSTDYRGAAVLDLGAHKGYFTIYCLLAGAETVLCCEPAAANFAALKSAVESTGAAGHRAVLLNTAVGAQDGTRTLYIHEQSWSHSLVDRSDRVACGSSQVSVQSISALVRSMLIPERRRRLIVKMDIEGAECEVIPSMDSTVLSQIDELFVETHPFASCGRCEVSRKLRSAGFAERGTADSDVLRFVRDTI